VDVDVDLDLDWAWGRAIDLGAGLCETW